MFNKIKQHIKETAIVAVKKAEGTLGSQKGQQKKMLAIELVISKLPVPQIFKPLVAALLSDVIDDAIEFAVYYMNSLCEEKQS